MQVLDARFEELARNLHKLEDGEGYVYRASREISRQVAEWVVVGAKHHTTGEILEQGGFDTGNDWYLCREKGTNLVVLVRDLPEPR